MNHPGDENVLIQVAHTTVDGGNTPDRHRGGSTQHIVAVYLAKRLVVMAALLVVISFVVFSLIYIAPGDPVDALLGRNPRSPEAVEAITAQYHLDRPFLEQYWLWLRDALRGDFGTSIQTSLPVTTEVRSRLWVTLALGFFAFVITMIIGVGLGVLAALRPRTLVDRLAVVSGVMGLSTPAFVLGVLLLYLFAIRLPLFPVFGKGEGFVDTVWHLTLPALALALTSAAYVLNHTRAAMLNVLDQDYITFARARGLSEIQVLLRYSLRNALIPVVTISGIILSSLIVGTVLVETTFSVEGLGQLLVQSAEANDLPVLQCVALLVSLTVMAANLLSDASYLIIDPRIRMGQR